MTPLLVFDGNCGFCTRTLGWLRLLDRHRQIETVPLQRAGAAERVGASPEECASSVRWRGADGTRAGGAEAIAHALSVALDAAWPVPFYRRTARWQERLYQLVADNRYRLPGITPWCVRYPGDCQ